MIRNVLGFVLVSGLAHASSPPQQPTAERDLIPLFLGSAGGEGDIRIFGEVSGLELPAPAELQGIELLPLDIVGRTELEEFMPDRARLREDIPDAARVSLPRGQGSLYHYSRAVGEVRHFGFFTLGFHGDARALIELPGTDGEENPWMTRVAVGSSGVGLLLATRPAAGGDLYEVDMVRGSVIQRTADLAPIEFSEQGLWLNPDYGFGLGADGIYRFARTPEAVAVPVEFPAGSAPTWFSGEAVVSGDRSSSATTAGSSPSSMRMFVFGADGPALPALGAPAALTGAGFLPESEGGPWLAVSDDGSVCAWSVGESSREAFLAPVTTSQVPLVQLTAPSWIEDTLDSVGGLTFFTGNQLLMTIGVGGDENEAVTESANLFTVQYVNAEPELTSLTAGYVTPPFGSYAGSKPERYFRVPQADGLLIFDEDAGELRAVLGGSYPYGQVKLSDVEEIEFIEYVGEDLLVAIELDSPSEICQLYRLPAHLGGSAQLVAQGAPGDRFRHPAASDATLGFVIESADGTEHMARLSPATGIIETFVAPWLEIGPVIAHSPQGAQVFITGGDRSVLVVWPRTGPPRRLSLSSGEGFVLPTN